MKRTALVLALLAAPALAAPAHAATAATVQVTYGTEVACYEFAGLGECNLVLTPRSCVERSSGPACTADPVTIRVTGDWVLGGCRLMNDYDSKSLTVHTQAFGDVTAPVLWLNTTVAGTVVITGYSTFPLYAVVAGAGTLGAAGPATHCEFSGGTIDVLFAIADR